MRMRVQRMRIQERVRVRARSPPGPDVHRGQEENANARRGRGKYSMGTQSVGYITSSAANPWGDIGGMRLLRERGGAGAAVHCLVEMALH